MPRERRVVIEEAYDDSLLHIWGLIQDVFQYPLEELWEEAHRRGERAKHEEMPLLAYDALLLLALTTLHKTIGDRHALQDKV